MEALMRFTKIPLALTICLPLALALPARSQQKPLTREQVINLVKNQFGDKSGARAIKQRGIDFEPTEDFLQSLRDAGANDDFIEALQGVKHTTRTAAKKPLTQTQILALLTGSVPSHRVSMLVQDRGIDFVPKEDFLGEVSRGGGDAELLKALRSAKITRAKPVDTATEAQQAQVRQHLAHAAQLIHQD